MVALSDSILKLLRHVGLSFQLSHYKLGNVIEQLEGHIQRVDLVVPAEQVKTRLLFNTTEDELFLITSIAEEELLAQEGKEHLATAGHVVKYLTDETPRRQSIVDLDQLRQGEVLLVVLVNGELVV